MLLRLAGLNVWFFHTRVFPRVADWDVEVSPPRLRNCRRAFSRLVIAIVISGRMIAYNWFD